MSYNERGAVVEKHWNGKAETESLNRIELKFRDLQLLKSQAIQEKYMQSGKMALAYGKVKNFLRIVLSSKNNVTCFFQMCLSN